MLFLIFIFGSPNLTSLTWSPFLAKTADFFLAPGVRFGLLYPEKVSPRYWSLPEGVRFTFLVEAITHLRKEKSYRSDISQSTDINITNTDTFIWNIHRVRIRSIEV